MIPRVRPMGFGNPGVFVNRAYREGKPFQWVRESFINPSEAGATEVRFDVDPASYAALGHLRMQVEDNGSGIAAEDIDGFLNTFGGGGKPIGDEHDNFGVGFKSSVMPWNKDGVVIRSLYDGEISVSVLVFGDVIGLEHLPMADQDDVDDETEYDTTLVFPVEDQVAGETWIWRGVDWLQSFPQWIIDAGHGTVFTFLGSATYPDTFFGDPEVDEERAGRWAYTWYADKRFWKMPKDMFKIYGTDSLDLGRVREAMDYRIGRKKGKMASSRGWQSRNVRGLYECIHMVPQRKMKALGLWTAPIADDENEETVVVDAAAIVKLGYVKTVTFDIGANSLPAKCHVYYKDLPDGINPAADLGWDPARTGLVTALYKNECYDADRGHRHRQFGIPYAAIYNMVWIIVEPVLAGEDESGVYPGTSRSHLHWKGSGGRAKDMPWLEWADEFAARMETEVPFLYEAIKNFVSGARSGDDISRSLLRRTADKFLTRFKPIPKPPTYAPSKRATKQAGKLVKAGKGDKVVDAGTNPGSSGGVRGKGKRPVRPSPGPNPGQLPGDNPGAASGSNKVVPHAKGPQHLIKRQDNDDLPPFEWVDFNTIYPDRLKEAGMADLGVLYIEAISTVHCHAKHAVVQEVIEYWVNDYGEVHRGVIVDAVQDVYGTAMSTAVGHIERARLDPDTRKHRLDELTSKLYGLYEAHELIAGRIRGTLGRGISKAVAS